MLEEEEEEGELKGLPPTGDFIIPPALGSPPLPPPLGSPIKKGLVGGSGFFLGRPLFLRTFIMPVFGSKVIDSMGLTVLVTEGGRAIPEWCSAAAC